MTTVLMVLGGLVVGYFIGRLFASPRRERFVQVQPPPLDGTLPPAGESARRGAASVHEFGALVERLAARDVALSDLACVPGTRWQLVVERGADADRFLKSFGEGGPRWATRVSWHAGDEDVRVEKSIWLWGVFPNEWQEQPAVPIGPDGDAIAAAEAFIIERFGKGA